MPYVFNIMRELKKHYGNVKDPKKKPTVEEAEFTKQLIDQINVFCNVKPFDAESNERKRLYQKFIDSKMGKTQFVRKFKIKLNELKQVIEECENTSSSLNKYDQIKEEVDKEFRKLREQGVEVHGQDLSILCARESEKRGLKRSCSSTSFVNSIKKKYKYSGNIII